MPLSHRWLTRPSFLGALALAALGLFLTAGPARAQQPEYPRLNMKGFSVLMTMLAHLQAEERQQAAGPVVPAATTAPEPRYVSIVGPDGRVRVFQLEGPVTVVTPPAAVVHFGANRVEPVYVPQRAPAIHFGANR